MPSSEPYVVIEGCWVVQDTMRAYLVECEAFPDDKQGMKDRLWVHKALMHPQVPIPTHVGDDDSRGDLVVLKRFVVVNEIEDYTLYEEPADE